MNPSCRFGRAITTDGPIGTDEGRGVHTGGTKDNEDGRNASHLYRGMTKVLNSARGDCVGMIVEFSRMPGQRLASRRSGND